MRVYLPRGTDVTGSLVLRMQLALLGSITKGDSLIKEFPVGRGNTA